MRKRRIVLLATTATAAVALPSAASADIVHVVHRGETLTSIATLDGLSEQALAAANGLSYDAELTAGTVIEIPPRNSSNAAGSSAAASTDSSSSAATTEETSAGSSSGTYVVQSGDTLSGIAASIGTTVMELAVTNNLNPNGVLLSGTTLTLPGSSSASSSGTSEDVSDTTEASDQQSSGADNGPYPTDEYVDGPEVSDIAEEYGVDPAFAEAIGWQESGWNNDEVSPTGAVGVMQIEPDTWNWIQRNEAEDGLEPASASDNVRGGVMLLKDLIDQTGSESEAAAAYYQGLGSVEQNGMYATTRQYVADIMALTSRFGG